MRKLCKAEITVLKKYGYLKEEKIKKEEYNNILDKIPYYVFIRNDAYYKYVVPEDVTDDLIEQLERAVSLDLQSETGEKIDLIQKDVKFFKILTIILLILYVIGMCILVFELMH